MIRGFVIGWWFEVVDLRVLDCADGEAFSARLDVDVGPCDGFDCACVGADA